MNYLETPLQMEMLIKNIKAEEVKKIIQYELKANKVPGYDLIPGKVLKELLQKAIRLLYITPYYD